MEVRGKGFRRLVVGVALGSLVVFGMGVGHPVRAAGGCGFTGDGSVSPGVKTQAETHGYTFTGTLNCGSSTIQVNGVGSGKFGCFEPGTSTASIRKGTTVGGGALVATLTFQHVGVSMTGTGTTAAGAPAAGQLFFYVTNPVEGGKCASTGLGSAQLAGVLALG